VTASTRRFVDEVPVRRWPATYRCYFKTYFDQRLADLEQAEKVLREVQRGRELS